MESQILFNVNRLTVISVSYCIIIALIHRSYKTIDDRGYSMWWIDWLRLWRVILFTCGSPGVYSSFYILSGISMFFLSTSATVAIAQLKTSCFRGQEGCRLFSILLALNKLSLNNANLNGVPQICTRLASPSKFQLVFPNLQLFSLQISPRGLMWTLTPTKIRTRRSVSLRRKSNPRPSQLSRSLEAVSVLAGGGGGPLENISLQTIPDALQKRGKLFLTEPRA